MDDAAHGLRTFGANCRPPLPDLDYGAVRPFIGWKKPELLDRIEQWLALDPPAMELATLACNELVERGKSAKAPSLFTAAGLPPIAWLEDARSAVRAAALQPATGGRLKGQVYAILRWGYSKENGYWGVYVGSTRKSIETRYVQHRTGVNGAKGLQTYGVEPLYSLLVGLNPFPGRECLIRETELHTALETVVKKVSGDVLPSAEINPAEPPTTSEDQPQLTTG